MNFILRVLVLSGIIFLIARFLPGVKLKDYTSALIVALVYAVLNSLLFWLFFILSLPMVLITFGLFVFVINAALLWLTDKMVDSFEIANIPTLFITAFLITIGANLAYSIFGL